MLGVLEKQTPKPFLLIKLDSFEQAYPGMLEWEKDIKDDLLPLFANDEKVLAIPADKTFDDLTISNKGTRVLRDSERNAVLIYTFIDNNMLLITDNEDSLKNLLNLM